MVDDFVLAGLVTVSVFVKVVTLVSKNEGHNQSIASDRSVFVSFAIRTGSGGVDHGSFRDEDADGGSVLRLISNSNFR